MPGSGGTVRCWGLFGDPLGAQRSRRRGTVEPDKRGGNVRSHRIDAHRERILGWIEETPDLTLAEVADKLDASVGFKPLPSVVCRFFQRHGVTRKKRRRTLPNNSERI